ncbi:MAG: hypothetical protein PVF06_12140 [Gammaproteobacteria bacterium]|jgi:hypothetical protein
MLRALAGLIFIIITLSVTALFISIFIKVTGAGGLLAIIVGIPVCIGALTLSVIVLERINSRINDKAQYEQTTSRKILR